MKRPKIVKVIIGPKDAGKSTGIVKLKEHWRNLGHIIVDLNLKGESHAINGRKAMLTISNQLMDQLV